MLLPTWLSTTNAVVAADNADGMNECGEFSRRARLLDDAAFLNEEARRGSERLHRESSRGATGNGVGDVGCANCGNRHSCRGRSMANAAAAFVAPA
mmetsp:Transcript_82996/g.129635  ORF Transcript_82996/g.129635 Transcript_82996/m.129635 type:complete len:96 (+) Transcript_82996:414-701(+)